MVSYTNVLFPRKDIMHSSLKTFDVFGNLSEIKKPRKYLNLDIIFRLMKKSAVIKKSQVLNSLFSSCQHIKFQDTAFLLVEILSLINFLQADMRRKKILLNLAPHFFSPTV